MDNTIKCFVTGRDRQPQENDIIVFGGNENEKRVVSTTEFDFRRSGIMIFGPDGVLYEAGGNLYPNQDGKFGSCQLSFTIPAGGFAAVFGQDADEKIKGVYRYAFEGAMLYNATMVICRKVTGSFNEKESAVTLCHDDPKPYDESAVKFLFVGNSSTYFNGTPLKFREIAKAAGKNVEVTYSTFGSAFLHEFADETHERGIAMRNKLAERKYDFVVLHDAASATYEDSKKSLDVIVPLIKANGASPLLYARYAASTDETKRLARSLEYKEIYDRLASDFGCVSSPACIAFAVCNKLYPEINLYADDRSHHSSAGSYLIAATWLYTYLGVSPVGNGYDAHFDGLTVSRLQECAAIAVEQGVSALR